MNKDQKENGEQGQCQGHVVKCAYCRGDGRTSPSGICRVCGGVGKVLLK